MKTDYQIVRESKAYTRAQWAYDFGIPLRTIYHWENGTREPSDGCKAFYDLARKYLPKRKEANQ